MIRKYVVALFSNWISAVLVIAGFISTAMTFVPLYVPHYQLTRSVLLGVAFAAWIIGPYRVFKSMSKTIEEQATRRRTAQLILTPENGSRYIRVVKRPSGETTGLYVNLKFSIENKGERSSTIRKYSLRIMGLRDVPDARPFLGNYIDGPCAMHGVQPGNEAIRDYVRVDSEQLVGPLSFPTLCDQPLPEELRKIEGVFEVEDTEGNVAPMNFEITEQR